MDRGWSEYWSDPPVSTAYRAMFLIRSKVYQGLKALAAHMRARSVGLARLARDRERLDQAATHHIGADLRPRHRPPGRACRRFRHSADEA